MSGAGQISAPTSTESLAPTVGHAVGGSGSGQRALQLRLAGDLAEGVHERRPSKESQGSGGVARKTSKQLIDEEKFENLAKNYRLTAKHDRNEALNSKVLRA